MPNRSKQKGSRIEREIVQLHRDIGIDAERVPLSGAAGGSFSGDIEITYCKFDDPYEPHPKPDLHMLRAEVKARSNGQGFATLERWKGDNDLLFLRRDRRPPLVVMDWETYAKLIA